jgi:hypothetical protein
MFREEIIVLNKQKITCNFVANSQTFLINSNLTLHFKSSEQAFKLGFRAVIV